MLLASCTFALHHALLHATLRVLLSNCTFALAGLPLLLPTLLFKESGGSSQASWTTLLGSLGPWGPRAPRETRYPAGNLQGSPLRLLLALTDRTHRLRPHRRTVPAARAVPTVR